MSCYLGFDLGTQGVRAAVYASDGRLLGLGSEQYRTSFPRPGWAEQDPREWWSKSIMAGRAAIAEADVKHIDAISVAATASSVVFLDAAYAPTRQAILWMDTRASEEARATRSVSHPAMRFVGGEDSAEWLVPKVMWLSANDRATYEGSVHIGEAVDYLQYCLSGTWVGSRLNAICKWNFEPDHDSAPTALYSELGIPELIDKLPKRIVAVGDVVGNLTNSAAIALGIEPGAVVAGGGIDAHMVLLPLSGRSSDALALVGGTSNAFITEDRNDLYSNALWGPYGGALHHDRWLYEGGQVSAGSVLTWLSRDVLNCVDDRSFRNLLDKAASVPVGSNGVACLDMFMGNRTPMRDARMRGQFDGLTLSTTPAELYRAAVEAVGFGSRWVVESMEDAGLKNRPIYICGGIRHNPLWLQTTVDILGREVNLVDEANLTLLSCAIAAATAVDSSGDLYEAAQTFPLKVKLITPQLDLSYDSVFDDYKERAAASQKLLSRKSGTP